MTPTRKSQPLINNFNVSVILRSCNLLLKAKSHLGLEQATEVAVIVLPYLQFAVDYLEISNKTCIDQGADNNGTAEVTNCTSFLLEALKAFEEYREKLPEDFLLKLWKNAYKRLIRESKEEFGKNVNQDVTRKILEVSNETEFQSICDSLVERMDKQSEVISSSYILSSLISIETSNDKKKQIRRFIIEQALYKNLPHVKLWKEADNFVDLAVPYIQFQISLLKRRKPMGSMTTLSLCMASITSVPLDKLESIDSYKTMFSLTCDLLNALSIHRLDVLSYRSHVYLQVTVSL